MLSFWESGVGTNRNDKIAFEWYSKAAKLGSVQGQYATGISYSMGVGTEKDMIKGYALLNLVSAKDKQFKEDSDSVEKGMTQNEIEIAQSYSMELYNKYAK